MISSNLNFVLICVSVRGIAFPPKGQIGFGSPVIGFPLKKNHDLWFIYNYFQHLGVL